MRIHWGGREDYRALRMGENYIPLDSSFEEHNRKLFETIDSSNPHLKQFYTEAYDTMAALDDVDFAELYKTMMRRGNGEAGSHAVVNPLRTMEDFHDATGLTRQLLMANPHIRKQARQQMIEGYAESFFDPFSTFKDTETPDYLRVMNGIVETHDDGTNDDCYATSTWADDHGYELNELDIRDQVQTLTNWEIARILLKENGLDPTSPTGASLG